VIFKICKVPITDKSLIILLSLYVANVFFLSIDNKPELLYCTWLCLSYTLGIALFIFGLTFYLNKRFIIASFFFVFFAFNKINVAFEGLVVLSFVWLLFFKGHSLKSFYPILLFLISLSINIIAPGNIIRQEIIANEVVFNESYLTIILGNLQYYIVSFFKVLSYSFLLIFPIIKLYFSEYQISLKSKTTLYYIIIFVIILLFESVFFALSFKEHGPSRTKIFMEIFGVTGAVLLSFIIRISSEKVKNVTSFSLLVLVIVINLTYLKYIPISKSYALSIDNRDLIMRQSINSKIKLIYFDNAPESGILNSAWLNDEEWLNNVYRRYYTKDSSFQIQLIQQ
jgi:hypothetical protein